VHIQSLTVEEALASLHTSAAGLTAAEAQRRLAEFGPNRLEEVAREPLLLRLAREFTHFFALVLWVAAALAFFAEAFDPGQGMARLGIAIVGVILVNGVFSFWQEYRAEQAVAALRQLLPQRVVVLRDGETVELLAGGLVPGDIVLLEEGDNVPADCRLIEAFGLRVNSATLTGESLPQAFDAEPHAEAPPLAARNLVLAGTSVVSGRARAVVYATGMRTEFGRIAHLTQTAGAVASPLQREITRLSRLVAVLATGLGGVFFLVGQALGMPFWENLLFAIGIIVANVPEGLLPTVTLSLAMATQRMAKRNALVRHLPAVEALGSTTVILSDKTGTLTQNRMSVRRLWLGGRFYTPDDLASPPPAGEARAAGAGQAVTVTLADEIDISRGDVLCAPEARPDVADQMAAHVIWMAEEALLPGRSYLMKIGTKTVTATVTEIKHKINVTSFEHVAAKTLGLNEIAFCNLGLAAPVAFDPYEANRTTGAFILIDRLTNATVGAGMVWFALRRASNIHWQALDVDRQARAEALGQKPAVLWFTGLSGSGKSTVASIVEKKLHAEGRHTYTLDGDNIRHGLNRDLGFTDADRVENIRRVAEVARLFADAGLITLVSFISPFRSERQMARALLPDGAFVEIFVDTPIAECRRRDPKGLYAKADRGEIANFTGIDSPYEPPEAAELVLNTVGRDPEAVADDVIAYLKAQTIIA